MIMDILTILGGIAFCIFAPAVILILNNNIGRGGGGSYADYMDRQDRQERRRGGKDNG